MTDLSLRIVNYNYDMCTTVINVQVYILSRILGNWSQAPKFIGTPDIKYKNINLSTRYINKKKKIDF